MLTCGTLSRGWWWTSGENGEMPDGDGEQTSSTPAGLEIKPSRHEKNRDKKL
jgi:hypothetical protein